MSRTARFVDTGYWLALINAGDEYHARAHALAATLRGNFVTTEAVLLEVGNALAKLRWRHHSTALLDSIYTDQCMEVVPLTHELFEQARMLYKTRPDKEWGLTDCVSFVVMQERGIHEALAADQHFVQAGFRALLAEA